MFVRTQRLLLRPAWPEDWQMVYDGIADEGIVRNLARAPWPYSESDARSFCARPHSPKFPSLLITLPSTSGSLLVGGCGIGERGDGAELGYWIARSHWGRGFATEAGRGLVGLARLIGHQKLVASHFVDNPTSGRVLEKIGFQSTGVTQPQHSLGRGINVTAREFQMQFMTGEQRRGSGRVKNSGPEQSSPLAA